MSQNGKSSSDSLNMGMESIQVSATRNSQTKNIVALPARKTSLNSSGSEELDGKKRLKRHASSLTSFASKSSSDSNAKKNGRNSDIKHTHSSMKKSNLSKRRSPSFKKSGDNLSNVAFVSKKMPFGLRESFAQ